MPLDWADMGLGALVGALLLAAVFSFGGKIHITSERKWYHSFGSGASVAYVFLDLLPELGAQYETFRAAVGEQILFLEHRVYLAALIGFLFFYGLESLSRTNPASANAEGVEEPTRGSVYWASIGGFAAYGSLIGYLLVERGADATASLVFYVIAMAFHFLVVDQTLRHHFAKAYDRSGHWLLALAVLVGWAIGISYEVPPVWGARFFAFVAGGVVLTSIVDELAHKSELRRWPFAIGAATYAALLLLA